MQGNRTGSRITMGPRGIRVSGGAGASRGSGS